MRKVMVKLLPVFAIGLAVIAILLVMTAPEVLSRVIKEVPEKSLLGLDNQLHIQLASIAAFAAFAVGATFSVFSEWLRSDTEQNEVS